MCTHLSIKKLNHTTGARCSLSFLLLSSSSSSLSSSLGVYIRHWISGRSPQFSNLREYTDIFPSPRPLLLATGLDPTALNLGQEQWGQNPQKSVTDGPTEGWTDRQMERWTADKAGCRVATNDDISVKSLEKLYHYHRVSNHCLRLKFETSLGQRTI